MKTAALLATIVSIPFFAACMTASEQFIASCSGTYTCSGGGQTATPTLEHDGNQCDVGGITLSDDGTGTDSNGDSFTWNGDAKSFDVCLQGACLTCTPAASAETSTTPVASATPVASCSGTPTSCSNVAYPSCDSVLGCEEGADGVHSICIGFAMTCASMVDSDSCNAQGCTWGLPGEDAGIESDAPTPSCQGTARSCSKGDITSCDEIWGCAWSYDGDACNGVARACDSFAHGTTCASQLGCSWK